MAGDLNINFDS